MNTVPAPGLDPMASLGKRAIDARNPSTQTRGVHRLRATAGDAPLRVLTPAQWRHWRENGYVVVPQAIEPGLADDIAALMWAFEGLDPHDRGTWYPPERTARRQRELSFNAGMIELYHHPLLWAARQSPRIHDAFTDLWGTPALWVSIDRLNFGLPPDPAVPFRSFMHWDHDPEGEADSLQGVLAINDQPGDEVGGFVCIPQLYRDFARWRRTQPADLEWYRPDVSAFTCTPVPLARGDLLIFDSRLCHGIRENRSIDRVRLAQYVTMMPAEKDDAELRDWRVQAWRERLPPRGYSLHGDTRGWERAQPLAPLTPLGERLVGIRGWDEPVPPTAGVEETRGAPGVPSCA